MIHHPNQEATENDRYGDQQQRSAIKEADQTYEMSPQKLESGEAREKAMTEKKEKSILEQAMTSGNNYKLNLNQLQPFENSPQIYDYDEASDIHSQLEDLKSYRESVQQMDLDEEFADEDNLNVQVGSHLDSSDDREEVYFMRQEKLIQ